MSRHRITWTAAPRRRRRAVVVGLLLALLPLTPAQAAPTPAAVAAHWSVASPSRHVTAEVTRDAGDGTLRLAVRHDGARVVTSRLGLTTADADLTRNLRVESARRATVTERYRTAVGKRHQHRDTAQELTLTTAPVDGRRLSIQVRVFDDGVGYRYLLPGSDRAVTVESEASSFRFPAATDAYAAEFRPNYENLYDRIELRDLENKPYLFPALFRSPHGSWALLSESGVDGSYAASHLEPTRRPGELRVSFGGDSVRSSLPLATPWRVAAVGGLADIVETDLITDLAPDARFPIPDWVRPGTVAWSWWSDGGSPRSFARQRDYVDHAAEEGWEYVLVDEGWSVEWVPELVDYARERGVGVLLWSRWTDLDTETERDTKLARWKSWGVAGLKVDFMDSDSQERMRWYDRILADTAEHEMMINFHGSTVPRGIERTWPHVLTMEGVRGAEDYHFGYLTPEDNVTLPFTRNVVGSMDYTPATFSAQRRETSAGHELALPVVYESGWQHPADSAETYDSRGIAEAVLRDLPTTWDETRLVDGEPGRSATVARRSGDEWFVGAIRAGERGDVRIPLEFLDRGRYVAEIVRDDGHDELETERRRVTAGETITVPAARNGGAVVLLCPARQGSCLDDELLTRVSVDSEQEWPAAGSTQTVRIRLENDTKGTIREVSAELSAPDGWQVRPSGSPMPSSVRAGDEVVATWTVRVPEDVEPGSNHDLRAEVDYRGQGTDVDRTAVRPLRIPPHAAPQGDTYLSDLEAADSFNWVGPVEQDMSNGGDAPGDGGPISIDGEVFEKGLGGHAHSEEVYYLGERCDRFRTAVGVDDSVGDRGSVVFQVWGDGELLQDTEVLTGSSPAATIDVDTTGVEALRLVIGDGGDFVPDDVADWGGARVACAP